MRFCGQAALGFPGAVANRCKCALDGIGGADMLPVLGREIVEGQQHIPVLEQLLHGTLVFNTIGFDGLCCMEAMGLQVAFARQFQSILIVSGMPSAVNRLRMAMPIAASVFWFSKFRLRNLGPMMVLKRNMAVSARDLRW